MQKKLKTGIVKKIDRDSLAVIVLGPKNEKGFYREKTLHLHCVSCPDEMKDLAFSRIRELLIGKKIQFDDYRISKGKTAADIFLDKKLVTFTLAEEGLVTVQTSTEKPSKFLTDLSEAQARAKKKEVGFYGVLPKRRKRKLKNLEAFEGKVVEGLIEEFNYELDFQFINKDVGLIKRFKYAGIKIPIVSKEHAGKLKNFLSKHGCQREARFLVKEVINDEEALVFD